MKKRITACILAMVMLLTGCGMSTHANNTAITIKKGEENVMEIASSYVWLYTLMYKDQYEMFYGEDFWDQTGEDGRNNEEVWLEDMLGEIKHIKMVSLAAQQEGIMLTEEEVEFCKANAAEFIHSIEKETQKKTGIDEEVYARFEEDFALYEKYKTEYLMDKEVTVDEESLRQSDLFVLSFYTYEVNEAGEITHFDDAKKEEVKKQAEEAYGKLRSGKSMESVAYDYEMDPEGCMMVAGRTPVEDRNENYDEAFENAAFSLKEGEFSKVIESQDGYHIIKMVSEINEMETESVIEYKRQAMLETLFNSHVDELTAMYEVVLHDKEWSKITFKADIHFVEEE